MKTLRLIACTGALGAAAVLSGCVVAPVGRPYAYGQPVAYSQPAYVQNAYGQPVVVQPQPVYVAPPVVTVVPSLNFGFGYYGGYRGGRHWR